MLVFDFNKAMAQVSELRKIANDMLITSNHPLAEAVGNIRAGWQGPTSQQFIKKCNDLRELVEKEAANIRQVADSLESSANTIEAAERAAAELVARTARTARAAVAATSSVTKSTTTASTTLKIEAKSAGTLK